MRQQPDQQAEDQPDSAAIATPSASRRRLTPVSYQNRIRPVRLSASVKSLMAVSQIVAGDGSSLSGGFTASRASDASDVGDQRQREREQRQEDRQRAVRACG